jgi:15-cis-phytoene synthase
MLAPDNYCERIVRDTDKDRFLATLFAPAAFRPALFALYALDSEVASVADRVSQPLGGEIRLQWWHDIVMAGEPDRAAGSPVASALTATMLGFNLPRQALADLIKARRFDLYQDNMATLAELDLYAEQTAGAIFYLAASVLGGGDDPRLGEAARHAGIAFALVRLLAAFGVHAARGRLYVPTELFERQGARPADLFAGNVTPEWRKALADLRVHARYHLGIARDLIVTIPENVRVAFLPAALIRPFLTRMESRSYDPLVPPELAQWRKQLILWRAARNLVRSL